MNGFEQNKMKWKWKHAAWENHPLVTSFLITPEVTGIAACIWFPDAPDIVMYRLRLSCDSRLWYWTTACNKINIINIYLIVFLLKFNLTEEKKGECGVVIT